MEAGDGNRVMGYRVIGENTRLLGILFGLHGFGVYRSCFGVQNLGCTV